MTVTDPYPRRFGRYVLVDQLARGGMGELHLAVTGDENVQRLCVVKQVLRHLTDLEHTQRFLDEVMVMARLSHGNLVPVLESGVVEGQYFLAMDFVDGKNLREAWNTLTANEHRLPLNLALYVVKELCRGLAFAHRASDLGLVHRDVSPPNILLSYAGEVRLADFGLAVSTLKVQKTSPGILLGKLPYMSPEQASGDALDARSDIFALGVILWELITGRRWFDTDGDQTTQLRRAMDPTFVAPSSIVSTLPPSLDLITRRALAPRREERFSSAEVMRGEVATVLASLDPTTDAATLQRFLAELYGDAIAQEQLARRERLDGMADSIQAMLQQEPAPPPDVLSVLVGDQLANEETGDVAAPVRKRRDPTSEIVPGLRLDDKYLIHQLVGQGGMGKIYQATHLGIERTVALKVLLPEYSSIASVVDRFQMEARAASRVGHPNVVEIFDSGTTRSGLLYYAMEFLEGTDLADLLHDDRTLEMNQTLRISIQICDAMEAAHLAGVIHRDLKPENVYLVVRDGAPDFVKLVDFGIARLEGGRSHTLPGLAVGTPDYMSPEQASGRLVDGRSDIYSLGVVMYEMLSGRLPPRPTCDGEATPSLRELHPELPAELEAAVLCALQPDPQQRFSSMSKLGYELRKTLDGRAAAVASVLNISAPSAPDVESVSFTAKVRAVDSPAPTRRLPWIMGGAALVLSIVALVLFLSRERPPRAHHATPIAVDAAIPGSDAAARRVAVPDAGVPQPRVRPKPRHRRPRTGKRRKPQPKAVRLEGTIDPFAR